MATFPLATLGCTITAAGITAPPYSDIYQSLQASFQSIYGADAYIDPDSQDGQLLAIFAQGIHDANDSVIKAWADFSPASAFGEGLSSVVKTNGIRRASPTKSTVTVTIVGQVGTTINNGFVADADRNQWALPAVVIIPPAGTIDVTATAVDAGAILAPADTVTVIATPTLGWQTVTNDDPSVPGAPVESDAALRRRQTTSTALPSLTVIDGIEGAVAGLAGVVEVRIYENDTDAVDALGLPEHSITTVVLGGDNTEIANAINVKKTPGTYTNGTEAVVVTDPSGIPKTIRFTRPTDVPIEVALTLKARTGYATVIGEKIKVAVAAYINALGSGNRVDIGKLYLPAQLYGGEGSSSFDLNAVEIAAIPDPLAPTDVEIDYDQRASCDIADITLTVT